MENDKAINCLMELLKGENFMSADYTNIALQNGTNLNVLREIYLCACDKISVKDVQEVIDNRKTDIAGYLRKIRYQKACGVIIGKGNNTLKDMSKLADAVQVKINTLGESIMTVEKKTGELSDMFVDIKPPQGAVTMPYAGVQQTATADVNSSGSITQMVYAANMLQIKLVQFVARLTYKGYLSIKSRDDLASFAKLSEGKYTIYSIPVSTEHVNDLKQLEALKLKLQSVSGKDEKKQIQNDIGILKARIDADSPVEQLKEKGLKQCCVLPKVDGESGTIQIAVMNKDDQIFKSWFASHIRVQMAGGKKEITDLKNFTEGNYTIFNLPFEGKELEDACRDFNALKMNYSILPDLKVGNDNSQIAVANADRNKFEIWIKMYREDMLKQEKQPGNIYEMDNESYMDTAAVNEDEYINNASLEYQKVNSEFEEHEVPGPKVNVMQKDDSEEFARLKKDGNYEMVTINKETLVDNMAFSSVSKKMREKGYFVSRIPGTYGENEKHLILPAENVFVADEGRTYVGFIPKNKPSMVAENGNVKTASYENIHKQYENVTRNMAYAKNLRPKAPSVNNSKVLNPKV